MELLLNFVLDEKNDWTDCCFVVFMGHGLQKNGAANIKTGDNQFLDIWSACNFAFQKKSSRLHEKPKVMVVQSCRRKYALCRLSLADTM